MIRLTSKNFIKKKEVHEKLPLNNIFFLYLIHVKFVATWNNTDEREQYNLAGKMRNKKRINCRDIESP